MLIKKLKYKSFLNFDINYSSQRIAASNFIFEDYRKENYLNYEIFIF